MTIVIGFNCDDSILIATDTHIVTPGISKLNASKLFRNEPENRVNSLMGMAGSFSYGRMAMQHLQRGLADLETDTSLNSIRSVIENEILQLHERYIYPHPDRLVTNLSVDLLIAAWSPQDKAAAIYWTEDATVVDFPGYACIGTGSTLSHFIVKPEYKPKMPLNKVIPLALRAVEKAKEFVDGVGGYTEWATMSITDGTLSKTERV